MKSKSWNSAKVVLAAFITLFAVVIGGNAQTPTGPTVPQVPPPSQTRVDMALRCDDTSSVATAREDSRNQKKVQYFDYTEQRNAESIQRARFSCTRASATRQPACEASVVARERRLAEHVAVARSSEDEYHAEMARRIDANLQTCKARYGGGVPASPSITPTTPTTPVPPVNDVVTPEVPVPVEAGAETPGVPVVDTTASGIAGKVGKTAQVVQATTQAATQGKQAFDTVIKGIGGLFGKKKTTTK